MDGSQPIPSLDSLTSAKSKLNKVERKEKSFELKEVPTRKYAKPNKNLLPKLEDHVEPELFEVGDPAIPKYLKANGYVVVKGVANPENIEEAKNLFWEFLQDRAGMNRLEPETWKEQFYQIGAPSTGIISSKGVGQADFMWYLRLLPGVKQTFADIWQTTDLLTSYDGANVYRPWHREGWGRHKTNGGWFHVDQGTSKSGLHCVQGMVTLYDATPATGGLCIIPGTHLEHNKLIHEAPKSTVGDFILVPPGSEFLDRPKKLVTAPAGSLILWDSRTIHCNCPSLETPKTPTNELMRMVAYICMTPQKMANLNVLRLRKEAFEENVTTSHWPHHFYPSTLTAPNLPKNDTSSISESQAALIGLDRLHKMS